MIENFENEVWKEIPGYESLYCVSNNGRVKSLGNGGTFNNSEHLLKPWKNCSSLYVTLCKNGKTKKFNVHNLVERIFVENVPGEEWKEIPGYEDNYAVSNLGNYKNIKKNKILKGSTNGKYKIILVGGRNYKRFYLHRILAKLFIPIPNEYVNIKEEDLEVDHINGNTFDNNIQNLRWCTKKENCNFELHKDNLSKSLKGKAPWNKGIKRFMSEESYKIISEKAKIRCSNKENCSYYNKGKRVLQYDLNGNFIKEWPNSERAAEFYNCSNSLINAVCIKKPHCKTAVGYKWEYKKQEE